MLDMAIYFHNSEVILIITSRVIMVSIKTNRDVGIYSAPQ